MKCGEEVQLNAGKWQSVTVILIRCWIVSSGTSHFLKDVPLRNGFSAPFAKLGKFHSRLHVSDSCLSSWPADIFTLPKEIRLLAAFTALFRDCGSLKVSGSHLARLCSPLLMCRVPPAHERGDGRGGRVHLLARHLRPGEQRLRQLLHQTGALKCRDLRTEYN